eukprot:scaffold10456_cov45-Cyclotella_meneghiniana.AAC.2
MECDMQPFNDRNTPILHVLDQDIVLLVERLDEDEKKMSAAYTTSISHSQMQVRFDLLPPADAPESTKTSYSTTRLEMYLQMKCRRHQNLADYGG